jgi:hypothetical protein
MSDQFSRISNIRPTSPVRPAQRSNKDRSHRRQGDPLQQNEPEEESSEGLAENSDGGEAGKQSTIDEYV